MTATNTLSCEQLEERLAALHQASLELVQEISIDTLLKRIARIACEQAGAKYAAIGVGGDNNNPEKFITVGLRKNKIINMPHPPIGLGMLGVISEAEGPIRVEYIQKDPPGGGFSSESPKVTSLLGVPIRLGDRRLGQIYLTDKMDQNAFTPDDERVIETLSAYAAVAISNARSYNELRERDRALTRRNQDLALLNNLASALASIPELDELLTTALDRVINYFKIPMGEIYLSEDNQNSLHIVLHRGDGIKTIWKSGRFRLGESLIGQTAQSGQPILVKLPYDEDPFLKNKALEEFGITQIACFPLTSRSEVLGVLCIAASKLQQLDAMDQQLLSSIASWVGTTIENARLNIQGRRLAVLEERERIGMDLHDGIIQSIYAVGLTLEHARLILGEEPEQTRKRIDQSINDLNSTIRDLRAFIMDMRPRQLYEENLMDGLKRLVNEFQVNSLVDAVLSGPSEGLENLPNPLAVALFHICQEALANIAKHAQANNVGVSVSTTQNRILMEIYDDGLGFDPQEVRLTLGHGISNMKTRARNVGGDLEITAEPGKGTTILAWIPFSTESQ